MTTLLELLVIASGLHSTVYGVGGEKNCGDIGNPVACAFGAVTASGDTFDPAVSSVAIAAPTRLRIRSTDVWLRVDNGPCHRIRLNDKMNARWVGKRGFDLSAAAVKLLTGKSATRHWSGKVYVCSVPYELVVK